MNKIFKKLFFCVFIALLLACSLFEKGKEKTAKNAVDNPIILISMDGYRWDYMEKTDTPNMDWMEANGVRAEAMIPVFPSVTFPNHLSIITGCYPQNHGIVNNKMWDPVFEEWYYIGAGAEVVWDGKWYEAEPFWVTVEKAGLISAIYHWPASEAEINGYQPSYFFPYDAAVTNEAKITQVLDWLKLPPAERPSFIALYFNDANYWGHRLGVNAVQMDSVVQGLDDDIGMLLGGLDKLNMRDKVNIIIVADHGMVDLDINQVIYLDDYIPVTDLGKYSLGPYSMISPQTEKIDSVYNVLKYAHPHMQVYKKEETPAHLHYSNHRRIPPIVILADESWLITTHNSFDDRGFNGTIATHGYDPDIKSMQAIFLVYGPHFKTGLRFPKFQNIHVYNLMADILGIEGAENDGNLDSVKTMLISE